MGSLKGSIGDLYGFYLRGSWDPVSRIISTITLDTGRPSYSYLAVNGIRGLGSLFEGLSLGF